MLDIALASYIFLNFSNAEKHEVECLSTAIYWEARGESQKGQGAVAHTILNRLEMGVKPSICKVVYQPKQFTNIKKARPKKSSKEWIRALSIATLSYVGLIDDPTVCRAEWYYNPRKARTPYFARRYKHCVTIGGHKFYGRRN